MAILSKGQRFWIRLMILAILLSLAYYLNTQGILPKVLDWIDDFGPWGPVVFMGVYILTCIFFVPSFVFTFSAGILFGVLKGLAFSLLAHGIGSTAALLTGRYLARGWVERIYARNEKFELMDKTIEKKGWRVVLLARLTPIFPFLIGNYIIGLTRIPAFHYFLATVIGSIPSAAVYVYLGSITGSLAAMNAQGRQRTPLEWALLIGGMVAAIILVLYLRRIARNALSRDMSK
ncbi:MAG: TVP38/TMEM64 family protein [Candidatus Omnitrophota bacterium]|nr:TVP38/TMEM64 family protein [Candidatus Omnitrophota bacterium]